MLFSIKDKLTGFLKAKIMKKQIVLPIFFIFLISTAAVFVFSKSITNDLSKDESPFNKMALPPRKVSGGIYMDGGSVAIRVIDKNGVTYDLAFPYDHRSVGYPTAYHGAFDGTNRAAKPFKDSGRAKVIALDLLDRYSFGNESTKEAYDYLSGHHDSLYGRFHRDGIRGVFNQK
jgi:hypothetical protein